MDALALAIGPQRQAARAMHDRGSSGEAVAQPMDRDGAGEGSSRLKSSRSRCELRSMLLAFGLTVLPDPADQRLIEVRTLGVRMASRTAGLPGARPRDRQRRTADIAIRYRSRCADFGSWRPLTRILIQLLLGFQRR
jgi:hypothetical protein